VQKTNVITPNINRKEGPQNEEDFSAIKEGVLLSEESSMKLSIPLPILISS